MYNIYTVKLTGGIYEGYKIYAPAMKYCTDNASMIASAAYFLTNTTDSLDVEVFSRC